MPKINKHLSRLYKNPNESTIQLDNSLIVWYDNLRVNPLYTYFSIDDIYRLNQIANSVSLANKPVEKYKLIGEIMNSRGFVFVGGGTNRRVYMCTYDTRVIAKVSTDKVGFSDNLNEYINQHVLKPFCCKIFEVTPCGTLAIIERVYPIETIEEFQSVQEDIFNVLYTKIRNNDIAMDDIGFRSYKNWGIRDNFGAVLLDYPDMYVADPKKCYCTQRDIYGRRCDHPLDYDDSFNTIVCTKCGHRYYPKSISKKNGNSIAELLHSARHYYKTDKKGECKMVISFINRFGEKVVKDLNDGKSNYVQRPSSPVYHNNIETSESKIDLGVVLKVDPKTIPEEENTPKVVDDKKKSKPELNRWDLTAPNEYLSSDLDPHILFTLMNNSTNISNNEISDIWYDHLNQIWKDNFSIPPMNSSVEVKTEIQTIDDAYQAFKLVLNSISNANRFYGKLIEFLSISRGNSSIDKFKDKSWVIDQEIPDYYKLSAVFDMNKLNIYLNIVKKALMIIPDMGFKINDLSPTILINLLDSEKISVELEKLDPNDHNYLAAYAYNDKIIYTKCYKMFYRAEDTDKIDSVITDSNDIESYY